MKYFVFVLLFSAILCQAVAAVPATHGKAHHVVVIVWDGMRPDFVAEKTTPNLWKMAQEGVTFRRHHPVYTSSTEVNGTAMATGAYPEHSGLMANREYRPIVTPLAPVGMELPATTVLWILGVDRQKPMDGRVLLEAMPGHTLARKVSSQVLDAENPVDGWTRYLKVSWVGTTEYLDEGNRGAGPE